LIGGRLIVEFHLTNPNMAHLLVHLYWHGIVQWCI